MIYTTQFDEEKFIYIVKAFAIFSVICAHCGNIPHEFSQINQVFSNIIRSIGSIGVPIFFVISGYLMGKKDTTFKSFFKTKISRIIIPWIICGTAVYFSIFLRKGGISIISWIDFILGSHGYLYFLSILIFFYFLYFFFQKNTVFLILTILLSVISNIATNLNMLDNLYTYITFYTNPFNWMIYFSAGLLINKYKSMENVIFLLNKLYSLFLLLFIGWGFIIIFSGDVLSYWRIYFLLFELISIGIIFWLAFILCKNKNTLLVLLGKESFSIYLIHMPFAGVIANLLNRIDLWWTTPFRPFIVLMLTVVFIFIYQHITTKLNISKTANTLIGLGR